MDGGAVVNSLAKLVFDQEWEDDLFELCAAVTQSLHEEISANGMVELFWEDRELFLNEMALPLDPMGKKLALLLNDLGVREMVITPGLQQEHLCSFCQALGFIQLQPTNLESDFVSYWIEEGESSIRIVRTVLEVPYLKQQPVNIEPLKPPSLAPKDALQSFWEMGNLTKTQQEEVDKLALSVSREGEHFIRHQFLASLMAQLSNKAPVVSANELAFSFIKVLRQAFRNHEWDLALSLLNNLSFLEKADGEGGNLPAVVKTIFEKIRSTATLWKLMAEPRVPPPGTVVASLLGENPEQVWRACLESKPDGLADLVEFLYHGFELDSQFWQRIRSGMTRVQIDHLDSILGGFQTMQPSQEEELEDDWSGFELASHDDFPDVLDASLIAMLDDESSTMSSVSSLQDIPNSMLQKLDELEKSIIESAVFEDDSSC